jgi:predicted transcriptional regulator
MPGVSVSLEREIYGKLSEIASAEGTTEGMVAKRILTDYLSKKRPSGRKYPPNADRDPHME